MTLQKYIREIKSQSYSLGWLERAQSELSHEDYRALVDAINRYQQLGDGFQFSKQERDGALAKLLECFQTNFDGADDLYRSRYADVLPQAQYDAAKRKFLKEHARIQDEKKRASKNDALMQINKWFQTDFIGADNLYRSRFANLLSDDEYQRVKRAFVADWFKQNALSPNAQQPNNEQIAAIAEVNENVLLKARAGSGKTSVVAGRTRFLIEHARIKPDAIMLLAFNRSAKGEMANRIRSAYKISDFGNAKTFHGLAHQLVRPAESILSGSKLERFIKVLVNETDDPVLVNALNEWFKTEYTYRRNHREITIKGEIVKSLGEKYIGDFLFEHGIAYQYVRSWAGVRPNHRPAFTIFTDDDNPHIVIEHWRIDENTPQKHVPDSQGVSWRDYKTEMDDKRELWESYQYGDVVLIETSIVDLRSDRVHFENVLREKLTAIGVELKKLDEAELLDVIKKLRMNELVKMFDQFIKRAKNQMLSPQALAAKIRKLDADEGIIVEFSNLANAVYRAYTRKLKETNSLDFNDLLKQATEKIAETNGNCAVGTVDNQSIKINQLKYLMVDEYQDFSPLFFNLIDAIRRCNPSINIFCVGDDWQAINGFAGSDLKYFTDFDRYINRAKHLSLLTNYRSATSIVDVSNRFMDGKGDKSRAYKRAEGKIYKLNTDDVWIEQRRDDSYRDKRNFDKRFFTVIKNKPRLTIGKTLKACHAIITDNDNEGKTFAIMSRTNSLGYGYDTLQKFADKLKQTLRGMPAQQNFDKKVKVDTTHGFKGQEADVVIMLYVDDRKYPLIHPDELLYQVVGASLEKTLDEERRLFYVGLTRAKEKLYLLCESGIESAFLCEIDKKPALAEYKVHKHPSDDDDDDFDDDIPF